MTQNSEGLAYGEGRESLLRAAVKIVAQGGLRALTYRAVAQEAGVTHGLVRHHFGSRDALIVAATEYSMEPSLQVSAITPQPGPLSEFAASVPRYMVEESDLVAFQYEVILESTRRPELRPAVRALYADYRSATMASLSAHGVKANRALAVLVFAALDGLVLQGLALDEPRTTRAALKELRLLIEQAGLAN